MDGKEDVNGKIEVKINSFDFVSSKVNLCIPWKQIEELSKDNKVFTDFVVVKTAKGAIKFK